MRKDNLVYYGSMADEFIVMLQILETKKLDDLELATNDCPIKTRAGQKLYIGGLNSENARAEKRLCISHGKSGRWVVYSG